MGKRRRYGKRNRDRKSRRPVAEGSWVWLNREELRVKIDSRGVLSLVIYRPQSLGTYQRALAADWLRQNYLSHLTFQECYRELWGEAF